MTENEAIKELDDYVAEEHKQTISFEAVTMARKALKEVQQCRAIGTVDEFVKEIRDWQGDIQDNEYDANKYDFVFERIYEIAEQLKGGAV